VERVVVYDETSTERASGLESNARNFNPPRRSSRKTMTQSALEAITLTTTILSPGPVSLLAQEISATGSIHRERYQTASENGCAHTLNRGGYIFRTESFI